MSKKPDGNGVTMVVITGHSGAGKSEAIAAFEDGGYFCVDNLPPRMIGSLGELFGYDGSGVERAAVVSDVRGGEYFDDLLQVLDDLDADGISPKVLFLEADEQTLVDRYKETRRRHPLAPDGQAVDGIRAERERARAAARARRRGDGHHRPHRRGAAAPDRRRDARERRRSPHGADPADLRLQERPAARGRPDPRRPLPAQPALRGRAAAAHRPRHGGRRVRRGRHPGGRVLRPPDAAARLPHSRLRRGGQEPPDDRDRVHRRPPPLDHRRRPDRRAASSHVATWSCASSTATSSSITSKTSARRQALEQVPRGD